MSSSETPDRSRGLAAVEATARSLGYECGYLGQKQELVGSAERADAEGPSAEFAARFADLAGVAAILDRGRSVTSGAPGTGAADGGRGGRALRGGDISLIAGACAVENEARLLEVASAVAARGATLLRGSAYEPLLALLVQELGRAGVEMLRSVRESVGIGVVTEVLDPRDVGAVAEVADVVEVGARSMASYALLKGSARSTNRCSSSAASARPSRSSWAPPAVLSGGTAGRALGAVSGLRRRHAQPPTWAPSLI